MHTFFQGTRSVKFAIGLCLLLLSGSAFAHNFGESSEVISIFVRNINPLVEEALTGDNNYTRCAEILFWFFFIVQASMFIGKYTFNGVTAFEIFEQVIFFSIALALFYNINTYADAVSSLFDAVNAGLQEVFVGNDDLFFVPNYIKSVVDSISFEEKGFFDGVQAIIGVIVLFLASVLLGTLAWLAIVWAVWGTTLAKLIGLLLVPTILVARFSFLFDGLLRFFISFHVFSVFVRINLLLTLFLLQAAFDLPGGGDIYQGDAFFVRTEHLGELDGLIIFLLLGILSLISSYKWASKITDGMSMPTGALRTAFNKK